MGLLDSFQQLVVDECIEADRWRTVCDDFIEKYQSTVKFDAVPDIDKKVFLNYIIPHLSSHTFDDTTMVSVLNTIKILTRTATGLEALTQPETVCLFVSFFDSPVLQPAALPIMVNVTRLYHPQMIQIIEQNDFSRVIAKLCKTNSSVDTLFVLFRFVFLLSFSEKLASSFINDHEIYHVIIDAFLEHIHDDSFFKTANLASFASECLKSLFSLTCEDSRPSISGYCKERAKPFYAKLVHILGLPVDDDVPFVPDVTPLPPGLYCVQLDIMNMLMYLPNLLAEEISASEAALTNMFSLLQRQVQFKHKNNIILALSPIVSTLSQITKTCQTARVFFKKRIFQDVADPADVAGADERTEKEKMEPMKGAHDESNLVKQVLIQNVNSFQDALRKSTAELLWQLCEERSDEYLRLVGFGRGVGLLVDKGLPGFQNMTQNAISLDDLIAAHDQKTKTDIASLTEEEKEAISDKLVNPGQ